MYAAFSPSAHFLSGGIYFIFNNKKLLFQFQVTAASSTCSVISPDPLAHFILIRLPLALFEAENLMYPLIRKRHPFWIRLAAWKVKFANDYKNNGEGERQYLSVMTEGISFGRKALFLFSFLSRACGMQFNLSIFAIYYICGRVSWCHLDVLHTFLLTYITPLSTFGESAPHFSFETVNNEYVKVLQITYWTRFIFLTWGYRFVCRDVLVFDATAVV